VGLLVAHTDRAESPTLQLAPLCICTTVDEARVGTNCAPGDLGSGQVPRPEICSSVDALLPRSPLEEPAAATRLAPAGRPLSTSWIATMRRSTCRCSWVRGSNGRLTCSRPWLPHRLCERRSRLRQSRGARSCSKSASRDRRQRAPARREGTVRREPPPDPERWSGPPRRASFALRSLVALGRVPACGRPEERSARFVGASAVADRSCMWGCVGPSSALDELMLVRESDRSWCVLVGLCWVW